MVTGESIPVEKAVDDEVVGATVNQTGAFRFRATKVGAQSMLAQIVRLVQQAQASRAPVQRLVDLVSSYFVPVVVFIAIATFAVWFVAGPAPALTLALVASVAVLIIACPCALGPATPLSIMVVETGQSAQEAIVDPVCGMQVDPATAAASTAYGGTTYWFCSPGCRDTFVGQRSRPARHDDPAGRRAGAPS